MPFQETPAGLKHEVHIDFLWTLVRCMVHTYTSEAHQSVRVSVYVRVRGWDVWPLSPEVGELSCAGVGKVLHVPGSPW